MVLALWCNIQRGIVYQKLQNSSVAKALMSLYIPFKILSFSTRVAQKVNNTSGPYSLVNPSMTYQYSELIYL